MQKFLQKKSIIVFSVCFSKIASIQCPECSCTLSRLQHRFRLEYVLKKHVPDSPRKSFLHRFYKIALFEISENFLWDTFTVQTSSILVAALPVMKRLTKVFWKLTFNAKSNNHYVDDNVCIRSWCQCQWQCWCWDTEPSSFVLWNLADFMKLSCM